MMRMKKLLLTIAAAFIVSVMMQAAPAKPSPFTHVYSDGSTVTLMMRGGEFNHSLATMDGLTVAKDENGDYCYMVSGALSNMRAHNQDNRGIEEQAFVAVYHEQLTLAAQVSRAPRREEAGASHQVPTMGSPRIPIILVNYQDISFIDSNPVGTFQNQFNEKEYSSLHYFESQSRGLFTPQFDILGPVLLPENRSFYGANVRRYGQDVDKQLGTMIYDACMGVADQVDFSVYDNDGDQYVDVLVVLYAGVGEAQAWRTVPESVWPCQWDMAEAMDWDCSITGPFELNGVTINKFAVFNELEGNNDNSRNIDGVGTFCHEFGHCLGLPDFYPTNGSSAYGMDRWDIMDIGCYLNNGDRPAGYTSYERHFMGWMDLIDPVENTKYTLAPLNTDEGTAVKVTNDANPDEYYLLEYRVKSDWDAYLPAEGILILHVDYDQASWNDNTPNNNAAHPRMSIIPADNQLKSSNNASDTWPLGDLDSLTNNSVPAAMVYTGGFMNKPITWMQISENRTRASFWFMKGKNGDINGDGEVNVADVNVLIDGVLNDRKEGSYDINGDGEINVADVNVLIDIILNR